MNGTQHTIPVLFLSTPSARRATYPQKYQHQNNPISIHALREEGDHSRHSKTSSTSYFYPRPPRGGRRDSETNGSKTIKFLSTPSARRATYPQKYQHQNNPISIHALREEGDLMMLCSSVSAILFLSTPSARRATDFYYPVFANLGISIHALREEGDASCPRFLLRSTDFYPRPPRGGRRDLYRFIADFGVFLSTPSARRATRRFSGVRQSDRFLSTPSARRATSFVSYQ